MTEMKTETRAQHVRARHVDEARHSVEMEGLSVDAQEFVDGRISVDELVARARVNCGLDKQS